MGKSNNITQKNHASVQNKTAIGVYSHHSGPIPDPLTLKQYEEAMPGTAQAIINQFIKESEHRHQMDMNMVELQKRELELEHEALSIDKRNSICGIGSALIICMSIILATVFIIVHTENIFGGALFGGICLASVVASFVYGTRRIEKK